MSRKQLGMGAFVSILVGVLALMATAAWAQQSIDEIAAKGARVAVPVKQASCVQPPYFPCGATNGLVNPVGFGGPTAIAWVGVDPVYNRFTGFARWQGKHQCPAANGGPWLEQEMVSDSWFMYSDHLNADGSACKLEILGIPTSHGNGSEVLCTNYKMLSGRIFIKGCSALMHQDPVQKASDPNACPQWIQDLDTVGDAELDWSMTSTPGTSQSLNWVPDAGSTDVHGDTPAVVQLR